MKGKRVTQILEQIKFEGVCGELAAKLCFQRELLKKYLKQTLAFI